MSGRLIVIEGTEGSGKSTLIGALTSRLEGHGVQVRQLREPGGTELSELLRWILKGKLNVIRFTGDDGAAKERVVAGHLDVIDDRAEALLFAAARAQLISEVIRPALEAGEWVLLDRFVDSSVIYQGQARGLGEQPVRQINEFALQGVAADRTLVLKVSQAVSRARMVERDGEGGADRIEQAGSTFLETVRAGYEQLASSRAPGVRVIDAEQDRGAVLEAAWQAVQDLI